MREEINFFMHHFRIVSEPKEIKLKKKVQEKGIDETSTANNIIEEQYRKETSSRYESVKEQDSGKTKKKMFLILFMRKKKLNQ